MGHYLPAPIRTRSTSLAVAMIGRSCGMHEGKMSRLRARIEDKKRDECPNYGGRSPM